MEAAKEQSQNKPKFKSPHPWMQFLFLIVKSSLMHLTFWVWSLIIARVYVHREAQITDAARCTLAPYPFIRDEVSWGGCIVETAIWLFRRDLKL
jgi:hypothetical protein